MPNPNDIIQTIDAVTGDLKWEYRRDIPDDVNDGLAVGLAALGIYGVSRTRPPGGPARSASASPSAPGAST